MPKNYIAIAGDSYAQGKGDWLLEANPDKNGPYHSAHLIQQLTKKDVISFGKSGASNIKGWSREPGAKFRFLVSAIDDNIAPPDLILAYFYAGNDLMENVAQLQEEFFPVFGRDHLADDSTWKKFFDKQIDMRKLGPIRGINSTFGWLPKAVVKIVKNELNSNKSGEDLGDIELMSAGSINMARVRGKSTALPDRLQSPGLELSKTETELGLLATERSLTDLKRRFSQSRIAVIYIPSVLEAYDILSAQISTEDRLAAIMNRAPNTLFPALALKQRSNEITARVRAIAESQGILFVDTRPKIQAAARQQIIHGPKDWLHFNRLGYEALANAIGCGLVAQQVWPASACREP